MPAPEGSFSSSCPQLGLLWMRKVALTALGRQANRCYLGRLPADLPAPLVFYTDEELIAHYRDGERGLTWHRELLIPFGSLIFSVSIKLALARRGVNTEKIKIRQLGWILYAFEWPILNNAPDGKLSGKWEYNRIQYEEMCTRVKREVEIAVMDHGVPYASNTNTFNFPNGVYIDASDMETLVSRVQGTGAEGLSSGNSNLQQQQGDWSRGAWQQSAAAAGGLEQRGLAAICSSNRGIGAEGLGSNLQQQQQGDWSRGAWQQSAAAAGGLEQRGLAAICSSSRGIGAEGHISGCSNLHEQGDRKTRGIAVDAAVCSSSRGTGAERHMTGKGNLQEQQDDRKTRGRAEAVVVCRGSRMTGNRGA
ncbi:unnamed protein product [Closterium sp. Naga37s-1]|nr:unnamed protein product [Closterium sp. Naga37s-1]